MIFLACVWETLILMLKSFSCCGTIVDQTWEGMAQPSMYNQAGPTTVHLGNLSVGRIHNTVKTLENGVNLSRTITTTQTSFFPKVTIDDCRVEIRAA